jgi:hypothetical protein
VGFLRTPNRVCVALSRARHGLFILGNIRLLAGSGSKLWIHVQKVLTKNGEVDKEMTLRCDKHPQQIVKVKHLKYISYFIEELIHLLSSI